MKEQVVVKEEEEVADVRKQENKFSEDFSQGLLLARSTQQEPFVPVQSHIWYRKMMMRRRRRKLTNKNKKQRKGR